MKNSEELLIINNPLSNSHFLNSDKLSMEEINFSVQSTDKKMNDISVIKS